MLRIPATTRKGHLEFGEVVPDISPQDTVSFQDPCSLASPKVSETQQKQEKDKVRVGNVDCLEWRVPGSMASLLLLFKGNLVG